MTPNIDLDTQCLMVMCLHQHRTLADIDPNIDTWSIGGRSEICTFRMAI